MNNSEITVIDHQTIFFSIFPANLDVIQIRHQKWSFRFKDFDVVYLFDIEIRSSFKVPINWLLHESSSDKYTGTEQ